MSGIFANFHGMRAEQIAGRNQACMLHQIV